MKDSQENKTEEAVAEEKWGLVPAFQDDKTIALKDFDGLKAKCEEYIKNHSVFAEIEEQADYKLCSQERTDLNKQLKYLQQTRLKINDYYIGEFNNQCKELEKMVKEASDKHTASINTFKKALEESNKPAEEAEVKPTAYRIVISTEDESVYKKILGYALKLGAKIEAK